MNIINLDDLFPITEEHLFYCVEKNEFWIGWFCSADFKREDHTGKWTYIYLGEL